MLMSFSENKSRERWIREKLRGRTGHRVARLNDSLFVVGGVDGRGVQVNEIYRINCQNNRMDSLILDTSLPLEGFSFFSLQETLYIWGGLANSQYSNQLMHFDGCRFLPLKQTGQVPKPGANHLCASFGGKFLIVFGGNTQSQFMKEWYLLNIKTFEWRKLKSSLSLPFSSGGHMIWLGGRGILLLNQAYDQQLKLYQPNQLYEFYVSDFNTGTLKIVPISLPSLSYLATLVFTALVPFDKQSFLLLGGHSQNFIQDIHSVCFKVTPQLGHFEQLSLPLPSLLGFQSIFYKNSLYLIGGDSPTSQHYHGILSYSFQAGERPYKRHVCEMCRLYFDEEWIQSSQQIYLNSTIREQYDYNYRMRMDNRVLQRLSSYIRQQFYALTLLLNCLKNLTAQEIDVSLQKIKEMSNEGPELIDQHYQYLKISCSANESMVASIVNEILLEKQLQASSDIMLDETDLTLTILRLKLGMFRLGNTALLVFRLSTDEIFVIYYSSNQLECTNTHFRPFPCYSYTYNLRTKTSNSDINRHIVHQNLKPIFKRHQDYQDIGDFNFAIVVACGDELESELTLFQQSAELETGESSIVGLKEDRKTVPLIQLAFVPSQKTPPTIFIEHNPLKFHSLYELMEGDQQNRILQQIDLKDYGIKQNSDIFQRISLFFHPEEYWFKRILIYHKGRLISHFRQPQKRLCGIIELQSKVQLDLAGTNLANLEDKLVVQRLLGQIQSLKRSKFN